MSVHHRRRERGAVAVEFALVLPLLLTLLFGIIEFGRIYNAQIVFSNAAREAARTMAIKDDPGQASSAAQAVAAGYTIAVATGSCAPEAQVTSTVTGQLDLLTGSWFGWGPVNLTGVGAMRCGG
ncbi:TadE/TadG family type IV pilus assembly protein [Sinomonas halotolerans]|uniref:TadE/TadG family type IV pilus assembly protein n=1 Tax=Sinomonas halotolerans TaxID=1644133 RepID=A0ABU9WYG4_9MICC